MPNRLLRTVLVSGAALAVAVGSATALAAPATAAPVHSAPAAVVHPAVPIAITGGCTSEDLGIFTCFITVTGGKAPYTQVWTPGPETYPYPGTSVGHCVAGDQFSMTVKVTDSKPKSATATFVGICSRNVIFP